MFTCKSNAKLISELLLELCIYCGFVLACNAEFSFLSILEGFLALFLRKKEIVKGQMVETSEGRGVAETYSQQLRKGPHLLCSSSTF